MNNSKIIDLLNGYVMYQWVCDYQMCSYYIEEMKKIEKDLKIRKNKFNSEYRAEPRQESEDIVDKIILTEMSKAIKSFKLFEQDFYSVRENQDVFLSTSNDLLSTIVFKSNPVSYNIRAVINKFEKWNEPVLIPDKGIVLNSESEGSKLEYIYDVEREEFFGYILFTSLGIAEGEIYENKGSKALDRREAIIDIVEKISKGIYL